MNKKLFAIIIVFSSGCSIDPVIQSKDSAPVSVPIDVMAVPNAIPKYEKRTRAGNPPEYTVLGKQYKILAESKGYQQKGVASWYGRKFHGRDTSNGEVYNMYAMTAAHKTLPIPSYVQVTNLKNQRSVVLRINDRGPFHDNRIIDLSYTAAVKLGIQQAGTGFVNVVAIDVNEPVKKPQNTRQATPVNHAMRVFLQIGAFADLNNANQLQKKLNAGNIKQSRVQIAPNQKNLVYNVQVGPLLSVEQADAESKKLSQLGYADTQLIVEKN